MAINVAGNGGVVAEVSGTGFRALRVESRPVDPGANGAYRKTMLSGTMTAGMATNSEIFQFRWSDATRLCILQKVILDGLVGSATAFTAGFGKVDLMIARLWTASGGGGTPGTLTGNNAKLRTAYSTSLLGDLRIAATGGLSTGTKTFDTDPIGQIALTFGTAVSATYAGQVVLFGEDVGTQHPLVFAQNEGVVVRASVPATGTWQFGVTVQWTEVDTY